jgi:hypothetical protein
LRLNAKFSCNGGRQTGGLRSVVSHHAVLDRNIHRGLAKSWAR